MRSRSRCSTPARPPASRPDNTACALLRPVDEAECGLGVVAPEHGRVHVDELDVHEVGQGRADDLRVGQRPGLGGRVTVDAERLVDRTGPLVVRCPLPDQHREPPARPEGSGQVREGRGRVGEEHHAEPAHDDVEACGRERVRLGVGDHELRVGQSFLVGEQPGVLDQRRGHVHTEHAARSGGAGRPPGRDPRAAADVEHPVGGRDRRRCVEYLVVLGRLAVEDVGEGDAMLGHDARPRAALRGPPRPRRWCPRRRRSRGTSTRRRRR